MSAPGGAVYMGQAFGMIARVFESVQAGITEGDWEAAARALGATDRTRPSLDDMARRLRANRRELRRACRDAGLRGLSVEGDRATFDIDWGRLGLRSRRIELVRREGAWRATRFPWGERAVRQPRRPVRTHDAAYYERQLRRRVERGPSVALPRELVRGRPGWLADAGRRIRKRRPSFSDVAVRVLLLLLALHIPVCFLIAACPALFPAVLASPFVIAAAVCLADVTGRGARRSGRPGP
jgi:hypothetical protein